MFKRTRMIMGSWIILQVILGGICLFFPEARMHAIGAFCCSYVLCIALLACIFYREIDAQEMV